MSAVGLDRRFANFRQGLVARPAVDPGERVGRSLWHPEAAQAPAAVAEDAAEAVGAGDAAAEAPATRRGVCRGMASHATR